MNNIRAKKYPEGVRASRFLGRIAASTDMCAVISCRICQTWRKHVWWRILKKEGIGFVRDEIVWGFSVEHILLHRM